MMKIARVVEALIGIKNTLVMYYHLSQQVVGYETWSEAASMSNRRVIILTGVPC